MIIIVMMTLSYYYFFTRLDQRIRQLEEEQRHKMTSWAEKTESLEAWLVQNETMVESYQPIGYDINHVRGQSEEAQVSQKDRVMHNAGTFSSCQFLF